jgi:3-ketosteroid 9alpha-monooxygenase subunit B
VQTTLDGRTHLRCYSVSSLYADEPLRITIKRVDGGIVSRWLNDTLKPGDRLMVAAPAGRFLLRPGAGRAIFLAAGSGITPILPMIRHAIETDLRRVALLYWNRGEDDAIFLNTLRGFARRFSDRFEYIEQYGSRSDPQMKAAIADFVCRHRGADAYLCGPEGFMAIAKSHLVAEGFPDNTIFEENFGRRSDQAPAQPTRTEDGGTATVVVVRGGQRQVIEADRNQVLLETLLASGLPVPHSCKEGHCGACMVRLVRGEVERLPCSALSRRDRQKGLILACRSTPAAPELEISYDF